MSGLEIISPFELRNKLNHSELRIFDVSTALVPSMSGVGYDAFPLEENWIACRIPNSMYIDVPRYLSEQTKVIRVGVPSKKKVTRFMLTFNLGIDDPIVLYEQSPSIWATRVWWILKYYGFREVKILNCYLDFWLSLKFPVENGHVSKINQYKSKSFPSKFNINSSMWVSMEEIRFNLYKNNLLLINTLSPSLFCGKIIRYGKAGHIPGSVNIHYKLFTTKTGGRFLSRNECDEILHELIKKDGEQPIVVYCGGGISACLVAFIISNLFVKRKVSVYDGSLIEWMGNDVNSTGTSPLKPIA